MPDPLTIAGISAGVSLLNELLRRNSETKARDKIIEQLNKAFISEEEKKRLLEELDRSYNTVSLNEMNKNAVGLQGVLNPDTVRGLMSSRLLGERASKRLELEKGVLDFNKKVEMEKAQVPYPESLDLTNIITMGIMGYILGSKLPKDKEDTNNITDTNNNQTTINLPNTTNSPAVNKTNTSNPFIPGGTQLIIKNILENPKSGTTSDVLDLEGTLKNINETLFNTDLMRKIKKWTELGNWSNLG